MKKITLSLVIFSTLFLYSQENEKNINLEDVIVLGNRGTNRTKINTPVAVDVISVKKIQESAPQVTVNDLLNYLVPSFNSTRQTASDGTEHIDPASLRGMGPDQVLVLLNGKRRHTTSLVNYQNTIGNGSLGTDLSTIPVAAIDRIEVLRDGASAQYGSDAIAGVINIILKKNEGASASITYGLTSRNDGETYQADVNYGTKLGKDKGFVNITLNLAHRGKTTRTQNHDLDIFGDNFAYSFADDPIQARKNDDEEIAKRGLTRNDFNFQIGDAQIKNIQLFLNSEYNLTNNLTFYTFGGLSYKTGEGFGFRRLPSETSNVVLAIYPNGFQPILGSNVYDFSQSTGIRYEKNGWNTDLSNTFGQNIFDYNVKNTNNASLGIKSPTEFKAGGHSFLQNTVNLDISKKINDFNLAFGGEFRFEEYQIKQGKESSWAKYDKNGNIVNENTDPNDILGEGGAQSFIGFSPKNTLKKDRNNISTYVNLSYDIKNFNIDLAGRFENYSDFGNTLNGKLAIRYEFIQNYAIRGAVSSGFRAPSLHQQYFNNSYADISTSGNQIVNKGIFNNENEVTKALGIEKLKQETSINASLGFTLKPVQKLFFTIDGYYIKVNDRIVITSQFKNPIFANFNVESGRFFTNAIDTETLGIDLVGNYNINLGNGILNLNLAGNFTQTQIVDYHFPDNLAATQDEYFGPDQINIIENLSPKTKATLGINYKISKFNFLIRNTYFGEVIRNGFPFGIEQKHEPKLVTDLSLGFDVSKKVNFTIGGNNIFDVFPDLQVYENSYFGVFKYAPVQMGTTGSYFFGRLNINF